MNVDLTTKKCAGETLQNKEQAKFGIVHAILLPQEKENITKLYKIV